MGGRNVKKMKNGKMIGWNDKIGEEEREVEGGMVGLEGRWKEGWWNCWMK